MIHKIYASDSRFKTIKFERGLNVVLADRQNDSGKKDSCNGIGKSTLIKILHFCLGSDLGKSLLPVDEISDWIFYIEMDICGEKITAGRSIANSSIIRVYGDISRLPLKPEEDKEEGFMFYKLSDWKTLLGDCLFGVPKLARKKYKPSFRTLISYFIRTGIDAYSEPFVYFRSQNTCQIQIANAFLLGLNWEYAADVQVLKDENKAVMALDDAIKSGIVLSKGELEAERVCLQRELESEEYALSTFNVHSNYQKLQINANKLTKEIHSFANRNLMLHKKLDRYDESIHSENVPDVSAVTQLYEEAGIHFGDILKKTFEEVQLFHSKIVKNRKLFLQAEIEEIKNIILANDKLLERQTSELSDVMKILQTHGALDEFTILQKNVVEKSSRLENIKIKIAEIQGVSQKKKVNKAKRIEIDSKIQRDFEQSRSQWEKAIAMFNENSQALYNNPGNLIINISDKGSIKENAYSFDVDIPRSNSEGVGKMKIFCYDLMLVSLFSQQGKIDFLVHDSTMFDGVDSRQIAHALEHAHQKALKDGYQYICAFNSDAIPYDDLSEDFNINDFIRLTLTDQKPTDSLLGFRFELQKNNDVSEEA